MAEYRYYLIPDAMTRAFPEQFEKQTPTEFFRKLQVQVGHPHGKN